VHNKPGAFHRGGDFRGVHRIALYPIEGEMGEFASRLLGPPMKRADAKAASRERKSRLRAYAASRAND
jgi:hypothetical protein